MKSVNWELSRCSTFKVELFKKFTFFSSQIFAEIFSELEKLVFMLDGKFVVKLKK